MIRDGVLTQLGALDDDRLSEECWLAMWTLQSMPVGSPEYEEAAWWLAGALTVSELRLEQLAFGLAA